MEHIEGCTCLWAEACDVYFNEDGFCLKRLIEEEDAPVVETRKEEKGKDNDTTD